MKRAVLIALLSLFMPVAAHAAWWNPFSWKKAPSAALATTTASTTPTLALPSNDELYKRIAELEMKLDAARNSLRTAQQEAAAKPAAATVASAAPASASKTTDSKALATKARAATVMIQTATTSAAGIVYNDEGRIIAPAHAVWVKDSAGKVTGVVSSASVLFSTGARKQATVLGIDEAANVVVLQLSDRKASSYLPFAYGTGVSVGASAYVLGFSSDSNPPRGVFAPAAVAQKSGASATLTSDEKPFDNGAAAITADGRLIGLVSSHSCKVLEEGQNCLKYNVTVVDPTSARVGKLAQSMRLYKDKQGRTPEEELIRGLLVGFYNNLRQDSPVDFAVSAASGKNSFEYLDDKLAGDADDKLARVYALKLKSTSDNVYKAYEFLRANANNLHTMFINEEASILDLDSYQQKIVRQIQSENAASLKAYQAQIEAWSKMKNEYDSNIKDLSSVSNDYLMAQGVAVETAAAALAKEKARLLEAFSGETVNIF